ncbi:MAG: hypothetical protein ABI670_08925 [Chloroflexota bacterium]
MIVALGLTSVRARVRYSLTGAAAVTLCLLLSGIMLSRASASFAARAALPAQRETPPAPAAPTVAPQRLILLTDPLPDPQQQGVEWFSPTGHTLRGQFLLYWQQNGGLAQFGYPITEEFFEPVGPDNKPVQVQYFERSRFELHPENAGAWYEVLLGTLGRDFHAQDPPAPQQGAPAFYFPQTGHNISGAFQRYWETHGGLALHGYPITEPVIEKNPTDANEYTVQYFERSRFELHPENAGSLYEVLLGLLGSQLSEKKGYPYGWYPQYGRAADWSWLAGRRIGPRSCPGVECSCVYLRYDANGLNSRQVIPSRTSTGLQEFYRISPVNNMVIFGVPASDEPDPICLAPEYNIVSAQCNPLQCLYP